MSIEESINQRIEQVQNIIKSVQKMSEQAPEGSLRVSSGNYYQRTVSSNPTGTYLGKGKEQLIKALEEKYYCQQLLQVASKEEKELLKIQKELRELKNCENVFLLIPENKRHLITPLEETQPKVNEKALKSWNSYKGRTKYTAKTGYRTQNGEIVRSKSELIIADKLKAAGVPYYYEAEVVLGDDETGRFYSWYPDFQALNLRTGKRYFWEHFGLLDQREYLNSSLSKLEMYADNGIFIGKNLIITHETSEHNLNTEYIDKLIKEYLL